MVDFYDLPLKAWTRVSESGRPPSFRNPPLVPLLTRWEPDDVMPQHFHVALIRAMLLSYDFGRKPRPIQEILKSVCTSVAFAEEDSRLLILRVPQEHAESPLPWVQHELLEQGRTVCCRNHWRETLEARPEDANAPFWRLFIYGSTVEASPY